MKKEETKQSDLSRLMGYAGNHRYFTYASWVLSAISALTALVPFLYIWMILRDVLAAAPNFAQAVNIPHYGWMAVLFAVLSYLIYIAALMCSHLSAFRVATNLRLAVSEHLAVLPLGFAETFGSGKLRKIIHESTGAAETYLAHQLPDQYNAIATPVGLLVLLLAFDWRLGLLSLAPVVLAFLIMATMTGKQMVEKMRQYGNALESMSNEAVEYVRGIPVVKTFGQSVFSFKKFKATIDEYEKEYGSDIWGKTIETDGGIEMDVEEMARREVISNIVQTKALIAQADEYKISLTAEEQAQAEQEAEDFYNSLTDEQLKETGMEADTPSRVLQENALAKKIYDHVMSDSSAEVSDEQARMTTFYDMFFECYYEDDFGNIVVYSKDKIAEQKQKADDAYTSIKQQLSDNPNLNITFLGHTNNLRYAGSHTMSKDQILENYGQEVLDTLYDMQDGDISPVIETENGYHIFQMTYLTDEKATAMNKAELTKEANDAYFNNLLTNWVSKIDKDYTYSKSVNTDVYSMITFS